MQNMSVPLTARQKQILSYIANGKSNKQIASALIISEQTVKIHISAILRKLHANHRAHAVALAIGSGWISIKEEPSEINPGPDINKDGKNEEDSDN